MVKFSKNLNNIYVIAEIGLNHNGSLESALHHIKAAKNSGCDAVKFQTYITEKRVKDPNSPLRDILKPLELTHKDFSSIKKYCEDIDIEFFSTAFDIESVDFLLSLGIDLFKVSSFDSENIDLLKYLRKKANRIIFSTGMTNFQAIQNNINLFKDKISDIAVLHCVSSYPTPDVSARLINIKDLKSKFNDLVIGYSDHTKGIIAPLVSVGFGARVIEKHFKISSEHSCVDAEVSISPNQMSAMVENLRTAYKMIGDRFYGISDLESELSIYRRQNLS